MCLNGCFFVVVLVEIIQYWCDGVILVVMVGMVGSNVGWKIVFYLLFFVVFLDIGQQLIVVGDNIWIIFGFCVFCDDNYNVMCGEEMQLLGVCVLVFLFVYVMLGIYCKWVLVDCW